MQPTTTTQDILIIEPGRTEKNYWADLWRYRELFFILAWRDVSVRYKQTIIGVAWAIVRPFLTMVVFSLFFGRLAGLGEKTGIKSLVVVGNNAYSAWRLKEVIKTSESTFLSFLQTEARRDEFSLPLYRA